MDCSRCRTAGYKEKRVTRTRTVYKHNSLEKFNENNIPDNWADSLEDDFGTGDSETAVESANDLTARKTGASFVKEFVRYYSGQLVISLIAALFCLASLLFLAKSAFSMGAGAILFLGIFVVGLSVSVSLPFKLYREFRMMKK